MVSFTEQLCPLSVADFFNTIRHKLPSIFDHFGGYDWAQEQAQATNFLLSRGEVTDPAAILGAPLALPSKSRLFRIFFGHSVSVHLR
jgi:hypothetical protein